MIRWALGMRLIPQKQPSHHPPLKTTPNHQTISPLTASPPPPPPPPTSTTPSFIETSRQPWAQATSRPDPKAPTAQAWKACIESSRPACVAGTCKCRQTGSSNSAWTQNYSIKINLISIIKMNIEVVIKDKQYNNNHLIQKYINKKYR